MQSHGFDVVSNMSEYGWAVSENIVKIRTSLSDQTPEDDQRGDTASLVVKCHLKLLSLLLIYPLACRHRSRFRAATVSMLSARSQCLPLTRILAIAKHTGGVAMLSRYGLCSHKIRACYRRTYHWLLIEEETCSTPLVDLQALTPIPLLVHPSFG